MSSSSSMTRIWTVSFPTSLIPVLSFRVYRDGTTRSPFTERHKHTSDCTPCEFSCPPDDPNCDNGRRKDSPRFERQSKDGLAHAYSADADWKPD